MTSPIEFTCTDCGYRVYLYNTDTVPIPLRCLTCQWVAKITDDTERAELRAWLKKNDTHA